MAGCGASQAPVAPTSSTTHPVGVTTVPVTVGGYNVLHRFRGVPNDGAAPIGLIAYNGELYGTTGEGGSEGRGTVFAISTTGRERILHIFHRRGDGEFPSAALTAFNGALYGTTSYGGASGEGTLFEVGTSGKERVLYSFKGTDGQGSNGDGARPATNLVAIGGVLYGTTKFGGRGAGCGTAFAFDPGSHSESVIYRFQCEKDGDVPNALIAFDGKLYGTTYVGGTGGCNDDDGCGTVFEVSRSGKERILYRFRGGADGEYPSGLVAVSGVLYGTTYEGGDSRCSNGTTIVGCGTLFEIDSAGKKRTLHSFQGKDGRGPDGLVELEGTVYGATASGGAGNHGTILTLSASGDARTIYAFKQRHDGTTPSSGFAKLNGALYGTTVDGGYHRCDADSEITPCGTVFRLEL